MMDLTSQYISILTILYQMRFHFIRALVSAQKLIINTQTSEPPNDDYGWVADSINVVRAERIIG